MTTSEPFDLSKYQNNSNIRYDSFEQKIVVRVDLEHVETFRETFGVEPFRTSPEHSDFVIQTSAGKRGDDETIMYDIDYALPDLPPFTGWKVLWGESVY